MELALDVVHLKPCLPSDLLNLFPSLSVGDEGGEGLQGLEIFHGG